MARSKRTRAAWLLLFAPNTLLADNLEPATRNGYERTRFRIVTFKGRKTRGLATRYKGGGDYFCIIYIDI